jgi:hypothetical protein
MVFFLQVGGNVAVAVAVAGWQCGSGWVAVAGVAVAVAGWQWMGVAVEAGITSVGSQMQSIYGFSLPHCHCHISTN